MIDSWKYNILHGWNWLRVLRAAMAVFIIAEAFKTQDLFFGIFGGFFLLQAALNVGCCGAGACDINQAAQRSKSLNDKTENTTFTEVN